MTGYKTNHSLRATAASRLYHSGLDEQLIMERTGHRSIEGIRSYKRTSNQQQVTVSNVLNSAGLMVDYTTRVLTRYIPGGADPPFHSHAPPYYM